MPSKKLFEKLLSKHDFDSNHIVEFKSLGGGCINQVFELQTPALSILIKINDAQYLSMFQKELIGLALLSEKSNFCIPKVYGCGSHGNLSYLLMEFLPGGAQDQVFWERFGENLAHLHTNSASNFGLDHDNFIGSLNQFNAPRADWVSFFVECRLSTQLALAEKKGLVSTELINKFNRLYAELPSILPSEGPAFLHGDLWSGNMLSTSNSVPALIDPAVYYGHREAEMAFTQLFGGFHPKFYESYNHHNPVLPGFDQRIDIYNLYPLLVHLNLFGTGYLGQIQQILRPY